MNTRISEPQADTMLSLFSFEEDGTPSCSPDAVFKTPQPERTSAAKPHTATQITNNTRTAATAQKKTQAKAVKPKKPTFLDTIKAQNTIEEFLTYYGIPGIVINEKYFAIESNILEKLCYDSVKKSNPDEFQKTYYLGDNTYGFKIAWLDSSCNCWTNTVSFKVLSGLYWNDKQLVSGPLSLGKKWDITGRLYGEVFFIQNNQDLSDIIEMNNQWGYRFIINTGCDVKNFAMAPYLETLCKAGFAFANTFLKRDRQAISNMELFNRLCKPGTKPKDILKTSKTVYSVLKHDDNISTWDIFRRLDKTGKISQDAIQQAYDFKLQEKQLEKINTILGMKHNGKPVFTWESLTNYLGRLDTYEAITRDLALDLLCDYLRMCAYLKVTPRTDSDSLRREHDVMSRIVMQKQASENARQKEMMENVKDPQKRLANLRRHEKETEAYSYASIYNYTENIYLIRGIRDFDELIDEASQQANCVAAYHERIITGQALIFTMRESAHPEKSLITVELSPDGKTIRQKYLAHNKAIHNKSQSEFIERWFQHVKTVNRQNNP